MDYKNGKIYRIVCEETGLQYIGSTCSTLVKRLSGHKRNKRCACKDFINPKIFLIEDYPCDRKDQLLMRERYHMENTECVNLVRPIITKEDKQEYHKVYYKSNMERYEKNKDYLNEKITCECGSIVCRRYISIHKRSKKHKRLLGGIEL